MSIRTRVTLLFLSAFAHDANADQCGVVDLNCLETSSVYVDGVRLNDVCIRVQKTEDCAIIDPVNSCIDLSSLAQAPDFPLSNNQCQLVSEACTDFAFGECIEWARSYECFNASNVMGDASLSTRHFSNLQEEFTTSCGANQNNPDCSFERTQVTQGYATRLINTRSVTRSWWQRQHHYDCSIGSLEDTCRDLDASPICRQTGVVSCIAHGSDGRCIAQREEYLCESNTSFAPQCAIVEICEAGSCDLEEDEQSGDYVQAAAWLNFLDSATKNNTCEVADPNEFDIEGDISVDECISGTFINGNDEPTIFNGDYITCTSGLFGSCGGSNIVNVNLNAGTAHYLRSSCRGWLCLSKRHHYCAYNSKFARVFQEQANIQTGSQFSNDCPALTIQQLESLDVEAMDLSEVFGDMLEEANQPVQDLVIQRLSSELGVFQLDVERTMGGQGQ